MSTNGNRLLVTGASGFVGRHLLDALKDTHRILAVAQGPSESAKIPDHPNIEWFHTDLADSRDTYCLYERVLAAGGADHVIHLAAYYDFTGKDAPAYQRTNIDGLRNTLEISRLLGPKRFVFASSVAACDFTGPGQVIDENVAAADCNFYARSKRIGEEMLQQHQGKFRTTIIRFAALFSDWCEYLPLHYFLSHWLSSSWRSQVLAGRGDSAIPFLHVADAVNFIRRTIAAGDVLDDAAVLIASPDGATTHRELYTAATACHFGGRRKPIMVPKLACRLGLWSLDTCGRALGQRPFERPWMAQCIDRGLRVDAGRTRELLDWAPTPHLSILRRMPFLIQNRKTYPDEWHHRNHVAVHHGRLRINMKIQALLADNEDAICRRLHEFLTDPANRPRFSAYLAGSLPQIETRHHLLLKQLMCATRTGDMGVFMNCCRHLAERWQEQGLPLGELREALESLGQVCLATLQHGADSKNLRNALHDHITLTFQFATDAVQDVHDRQALSRT